MNLVDLTNKVFGRLTVISRAENKGIATAWHCKCECGSDVITTGGRLGNGSTKSCGCLQKELASSRVASHRLSRTREHKIWGGMRNRCNNPKNGSYYRYGGRGITVCAEWDSFEQFLEDMGHAPDGTSIERINNNEGYSKSNCKWAGTKEQGKNKRNAVMLEYKGEKASLATFAEKYGIPVKRLSARLIQGWTIDDAITIPMLRGNQSREHYHRK